MPWFNDIDDERPTDIEFVSEGAERFRELKRALIERFETAFKGFPDENPDRAGETLLFPIASVRVGTEAQKPEVPEREGAGWFSTDTGILWIANRDLEWVKAADPAAGSGDDERVKVEFSGTLSLLTGESVVTSATISTTVNGHDHFPREFFVRFRVEGMAEWSRYYQMNGLGHTAPIFATSQTVDHYVIPNSSGTYHGSAILLDDDNEMLRMNIRIQQAAAGGSPASIEYQGVCQFHRMRNITLGD